MATTARGWPYPLGTDKVVDGDNVMHSISDRLDSNLGLTRIAGNLVTTAAAETLLDGCFTDLYPMYRVLFTFKLSASGALNVRLRAAGVDNTAASYGNARLFLSSASAVGGAYATANLWTLPGTSATIHTGGFDIFNTRDATAAVQASGTLSSPGASFGSSVGLWGGNMGVLDNFDGIKFYLASGTLTGRVDVYGYR